MRRPFSVLNRVIWSSTCVRSPSEWIVLKLTPALMLGAIDVAVVVVVEVLLMLQFPRIEMRSSWLDSD
jgi:hypothetical protein